MKDLTIIIPTLNEEKNILDVVKKCKKYSKNVLVVDDNSSDSTRIIAKNARAKVIHRKNNFGLTASVLEGIKKTKTKYFIVIDGDGQHDVSKISEIYEKLQTNDLVVGVRSSVPGWAFHRRQMSKIAEVLGKIRLFFTGKFCNDILSGFFGMNLNLAKNLIKKNDKSFVKEGYKVLFDFLKILPKNLKLEEVSYVFKERQRGTSKIGRKQIIAYLKSLIF